MSRLTGNSSHLHLLQQKHQQQMSQQKQLMSQKLDYFSDSKSPSPSGPFWDVSGAAGNILDSRAGQQQFFAENSRGEGQRGLEEVKQGKYLPHVMAPHVMSCSSRQQLSYQPKVTRQASHDSGFAGASYSVSGKLSCQRQPDDSLVVATASSSLHDLSRLHEQQHHYPPSCISPPLPHKYPSNSPGEHDRSSSGPSNADKGSFMEARGNLKASVTSLSKSSAPVTHYATLGRKPILKNPLRTPMAVRTGVGDFLSGKHQESAV